MAENIRDVIARVQKAREEQARQKAVEKPKEIPKEEEMPIPDDVADFSDIEAEEMPKEMPKPLPKPQERTIEASKEQLTNEQRIVMEREMLQNNGIFRGELLAQLQEINRALVVIAGAMVDLYKHGK